MSECQSNGIPFHLRRAIEAVTPDNWVKIRSTIARREAEALLAKLEQPPSARGRLTFERVEAMTRGIRIKIERSA